MANGDLLVIGGDYPGSFVIMIMIIVITNSLGVEIGSPGITARRRYVPCGYKDTTCVAGQWVFDPVDMTSGRWVCFHYC